MRFVEGPTWSGHLLDVTRVIPYFQSSEGERQGNGSGALQAGRWDGIADAF